MREASLNRVVNLESENEISARQNAEILIDKFRQFAKEDKFLSLNISSFCESEDFNDAEKMSKSTKFWSKIIGFIVGIFVAFSIRFTFESVRVIILPNPYLILGVICSFGFVFAYLGNMIGDLIIKSQRKALPENKLYQTSSKHWKVFIENIDKILDNKFVD